MEVVTQMTLSNKMIKIVLHVDQAMEFKHEKMIWKVITELIIKGEHRVREITKN